MALAQQATVHCGWCTIPWPWLDDASSAIHTAVANGTDDKEFSLSTKVGDALELVRFMRHESDDSRSFTGLMWDVHGAICAEPKDRLVALYGFNGREARSFVSFDHNYQLSRIFEATYATSGFEQLVALQWALSSLCSTSNSQRDKQPRPGGAA